MIVIVHKFYVFVYVWVSMCVCVSVDIFRNIFLLCPVLNDYVLVDFSILLHNA